MTEDIPASIAAVRKERTDDSGSEVWFSMLCGFFDNSPFAAAHGISGEDALIAHLCHRQELELRICHEIFSDCHTVLISKKYNISELP